jgi:alpha-D-glucose phosphate-specific phosphoglucomutase
MNARAGQPAQQSDLIDVHELVRAYYDLVPDVSIPEQKVVFGTSGHRGSSFDSAFNETHIAAITQAIVEYRAGQGITGPLFIGRDTHGLSRPAETTALEVLEANGVRVLVDEFDDYVPTPALSHAIIKYNSAGHRQQADGIIITPSHNPPRDGGFKYNPPHGGPADSDATNWIAARANAIIAAGSHDVKRAVRLPQELCRRPREHHRHRCDSQVGHPHWSRPTGRRQRALLAAHRRPLRPQPDRGEPTGRPRVALHDARLGRQDPYGPVEPVRDGIRRRAPARIRHRDG